MSDTPAIRILVANRLKVTAQRVAVLEVLLTSKDHPDAEMIFNSLKEKHLSVSQATIYKTLEVFFRKGIVVKVHTDKDPVRYDPVQERHHHLFSAESDRIEDFIDSDLDSILDEYIKEKKIPGFEVKDIRLQIIGRFRDKNKNS
ncbi:MAG TPA: transcriptional repressor [Bacteroidales bacterium]|nr:transcriptional repressor [Bacteroidales bacterium]